MVLMASNVIGRASLPEAEVNTIHNDYQVASTRYGKIRYVDMGCANGEVILFSTGGGAGYNSVQAFDWLAKEGFRLVSVNRPGYFDLPVDVVDGFEGHADIYNAVLTKLGIETVHVFGVSIGGLSALYYASKYPVKSMVLWSAVTGPYVVNEEAANSMLGKLVLSDTGKKGVSWMLRTSARLFPKTTIKTFLKTESDLERKEINQIARHIVQHPDRWREFLIFVESMTPMGQLYDGMIDEVEKATRLIETDWTKLSCSVLAVHSTIDTDVKIDHAKRLERDVPDIKVMYVRAGGHFVWWGKEGDKVRQASLDFFRTRSEDKPLY